MQEDSENTVNISCQICVVKEWNLIYNFQYMNNSIACGTSHFRYMYKEMYK